MQQYLPFTVLKLLARLSECTEDEVATVPTVYGIETKIQAGSKAVKALQQYLPFTVLKHTSIWVFFDETFKLQQYLPFTVLKLITCDKVIGCLIRLQQYLPFTVLKHSNTANGENAFVGVATVPTVYGIETINT